MTDDIDQAPRPLTGEQSRRDFIKRSAATGALIWSSPAILSLPGAAAFGQQYPCPCPNCLAQATGLSALGLTAGTASGTGCECLLNIDLSAGTIGGASSQTVCGKADSTACTASSFVEGLVVRIADNATLEATVLASCVDCGTGDATVANLQLVTSTLGVETRTDLAATTGCNQTIPVPGFEQVVTVVFNEQICGTDGTLTVRALRVTVLGNDVIVAESKAGAAGCPCEECSPSPRCTPPTKELC